MRIVRVRKKSTRCTKRPGFIKGIVKWHIRKIKGRVKEIVKRLQNVWYSDIGVV